MVEDNHDLQEKILKSPYVQDRRPSNFLPRGRIWTITRWEHTTLMLEVRPRGDNNEIIRHYTCPRAIVESALTGSLFDTMQHPDDALDFEIGNMGKHHEPDAVLDLYFRLIVSRTGKRFDKTISCIRYQNGIRVLIETVKDCKALFFLLASTDEDYDDTY